MKIKYFQNSKNSMDFSNLHKQGIHEVQKSPRILVTFKKEIVSLHDYCPDGLAVWHYIGT